MVLVGSRPGQTAGYSGSRPASSYATSSGGSSKSYEQYYGEELAKQSATLPYAEASRRAQAYADTMTGSKGQYSSGVAYVNGQYVTESTTTPIYTEQQRASMRALHDEIQRVNQLRSNDFESSSFPSTAEVDRYRQNLSEQQYRRLRYETAVQEKQNVYTREAPLRYEGRTYWGRGAAAKVVQMEAQGIKPPAPDTGLRYTIPDSEYTLSIPGLPVTYSYPVKGSNYEFKTLDAATNAIERQKQAVEWRAAKASKDLDAKMAAYMMPGLAGAAAAKAGAGEAKPPKQKEYLWNKAAAFPDYLNKAVGIDLFKAAAFAIPAVASAKQGTAKLVGTGLAGYMSLMGYEGGKKWGENVVDRWFDVTSKAASLMPETQRKTNLRMWQGGIVPLEVVGRRLGFDIQDKNLYGKGKTYNEIYRTIGGEAAGLALSALTFGVVKSVVDVGVNKLKGVKQTTSFMPMSETIGKEGITTGILETKVQSGRWLTPKGRKPIYNVETYGVGFTSEVVEGKPKQGGRIEKIKSKLPEIELVKGRPLFEKVTATTGRGAGLKSSNEFLQNRVLKSWVPNETPLGVKLTSADFKYKSKPVDLIKSGAGKKLTGTNAFKFQREWVQNQAPTSGRWIKSSNEFLVGRWKPRKAASKSLGVELPQTMKWDKSWYEREGLSKEIPTTPVGVKVKGTVWELRTPKQATLKTAPPQPKPLNIIKTYTGIQSRAGVKVPASRRLTKTKVNLPQFVEVKRVKPKPGKYDIGVKEPWREYDITFKSPIRVRDKVKLKTMDDSIYASTRQFKKNPADLNFIKAQQRITKEYAVRQRGVMRNLRTGSTHRFDVSEPIKITGELHRRLGLPTPKQVNLSTGKRMPKELIARGLTQTELLPGFKFAEQSASRRVGGSMNYNKFFGITRRGKFVATSEALWSTPKGEVTLYGTTSKEVSGQKVIRSVGLDLYAPTAPKVKPESLGTFETTKDKLWFANKKGGTPWDFSEPKPGKSKSDILYQVVGKKTAENFMREAQYQKLLLKRQLGLSNIDRQGQRVASGRYQDYFKSHPFYAPGVGYETSMGLGGFKLGAASKTYSFTATTPRKDQVDELFNPSGKQFDRPKITGSMNEVIFGKVRITQRETTLTQTRQKPYQITDNFNIQKQRQYQMQALYNPLLGESKLKPYAGNKPPVDLNKLIGTPAAPPLWNLDTGGTRPGYGVTAYRSHKMHWNLPEPKEVLFATLGTAPKKYQHKINSYDDLMGIPRKHRKKEEKPKHHNKKTFKWRNIL